MEQVRRGHTIRLRYKHYAVGTLADPDTYTIEIEDPSRNNVVDAQAMTKEAVGIFYYDYDVPAAAMLGKYRVDVKMTTGTFVAGPPQKDYFEVVKEVG